MIDAVFDRKQEDVERALMLNRKYINGTLTEAEKTEWLSGLKGALNAKDLNRIETNCGIVAENIAVVVQTKSWERKSIPRASDFERICSNIERIRSSYATLKTTPETPEQPLNTFQKWNDIEKILFDVDMIYRRTTDAFIFCGESYAGEDIGVI